MSKFRSSFLLSASFFFGIGLVACGSENGSGSDPTSVGDGDTAGARDGDATAGDGDVTAGDDDTTVGETDAPGAGGQTQQGTGGSPDDGPAEPMPSSGCDAASWPESGPQTIEVQGQDREYILTLPDGYDSSTAYELIYVYHGLNGTAEQTAGSGFFGYFGIQDVSDGSAILVAPQGLPSEPGGTDFAWRNEDGQDTAFARAMMERMTSEYCIDVARIFVTGMSYGGVASNDVGCEVGDLVRAIAPIAGAGPGFGNFGSGGPDCTGQVAALLIHGETDETVTLDSGLASRDHWLEANGCDPASAMPYIPNADCEEYEGCSCDSYSGCQSGFPVEWCTHPDGHTIPGFSAQTIWDFFQRF